MCDTHILLAYMFHNLSYQNIYLKLLNLQLKIQKQINSLKLPKQLVLYYLTYSLSSFL